MVENRITPVQLSNILPTTATAHRRFNRVYYQVQTSLGHYLKPHEWDLTMLNEFLEPITTILAPEECLNRIFWRVVVVRDVDVGNRGCSALSLVTNVMESLFQSFTIPEWCQWRRTFGPEIMENLETDDDKKWTVKWYSGRKSPMKNIIKIISCSSSNFNSIFWIGTIMNVWNDTFK